MRAHSTIEKPAAAEAVGRKKGLEMAPAVPAYEPLPSLLEQDRADLAERREKDQLEKFYEPCSSFS